MAKCAGRLTFVGKMEQQICLLIVWGILGMKYFHGSEIRDMHPRHSGRCFYLTTADGV
jgi:hypothetical protein